MAYEIEEQACHLNKCARNAQISCITLTYTNLQSHERDSRSVSPRLIGRRAMPAAAANTNKWHQARAWNVHRFTEFVNKCENNNSQSTESTLWTCVVAVLECFLAFLSPLSILSLA